MNWQLTSWPSQSKPGYQTLAVQCDYDNHNAVREAKAYWLERIKSALTFQEL